MRACACGCGEMTRTPAARYLIGHHSRKSPVEYVVDEMTGCWVWQRAQNGHGYGNMAMPGRRHAPAHRVYYERTRGPIPAGMHVDHLCRNRACVNPDHMEIVTPAENVRRGAKAILSQEKADAIRDAHAGGESAASLAERYGVARRTILNITEGNRWARRVTR